MTHDTSIPSAASATASTAADSAARVGHAAPLVLVLDIGSSSTRAMLYDATATAVADGMARVKSELHTTPDGAAEDDPHAVLDRVARCIDELLSRIGGRAAAIAAVGCATYASNLLGLDRDGQPVTPIYTYADTRSAAAAEQLRWQHDEAAIRERTGCPLRTSYAPALLTWLRTAGPELFSRVHRWATVGEWVWESLFGQSIVSYSVASWSGLLDRRELVWDGELLDTLGIDAAQLGRLGDIDQPFVGLQAPWAARWPALARIPWFSALGDGAAANVGSGGIGADTIALNVGTSGALRVGLPSVEHVPGGLWCYRIDRSLALLGGATSEGGNVLAWTRETLGVEAADLDARLLNLSSDRYELTVLPFIAGERSPGWAGDVRMTISGIGLTTDPFDLARAALEGVTYRWAAIADLLRGSLGVAPRVIVSGGGLAAVPSWAQLIADALDLPIARAADAEMTSRGVALLALRSIGLVQDLSAFPPRLAETITPHPDRVARHREARARQAQLYDRLIRA